MPLTATLRTALSSLRGAAGTALATGALAVVLATAPVPALAQSSIKIVVDDAAITSLDIQSRSRLLQVSGRMSAGAANKAAQDELIDEALRVAEAKRRGIVVSDRMVDAAIADIAGRSKMNPSQFAQALGQAGINIRTLRARIAAQMAWGRIVRAKLNQDVRNKNDDLIAQMRREETGGNQTAEDYVLQRVVFTLPRNPAAAVVQRRRGEAENLRARFTDCESGIALAKALKEVAVLPMGRKLAAEVPQGMREELAATAAGRLTKPQVVDQGVEMLAVCQKIAVAGENALSSSLDAEAMSAQGDKISKELTQELRQKANIAYR